MIEAIMFSAAPANHAQHAIEHLTRYPVIFWTVDFPIIVTADWQFPLAGYIHLTGDQVRFKAKIDAILKYSLDHNKFGSLKPEPWRVHFGKQAKVTGRYSLLISEISEFSYPTLNFEKLHGGKVRRPPESYIRVRHPEILEDLANNCSRT